VAGKGVPAALLMARLYSSVRFHLLSHAEVNSAMTGLNSEILTSGLGHRFITCVLMVIDPAKNQLTLVNAGHLPPLRRDTAGRVEAIGAKESGLPLGILPNQTFQQTVFDLSPGESWLNFTDGVTEAMRMPQEIYGNKRLMKFLETGPAKIDELIKAVVDDVETYVEGHAQSDDICMVGFQRLP
jgi:serine phosphatase RsbU (regulator of sigma subunit)